jgi:2-C-methyl-D-erythritol 4-phosphate cytidylyltransferase
LNYALLMPAAGSGSRLGAALPKALLEIAGRALFAHAAEPFVQDPRCLEVVIAAPQGCENQFAHASKVTWHNSRVKVITGGRIRQESVGLALAALTCRPDAVLIHDAARPLVRPDLIDCVLNALEHDCVAVVPGLPVTDTLKRVDGVPLTVVETVDRASLVAVQTPQALLFSLAARAFELAAATGFEATDDVSLIEQFNLGPIRVVDGDPRNFKITTVDDLARARELLAREELR